MQKILADMERFIAKKEFTKKTFRRGRIEEEYAEKKLPLGRTNKRGRIIGESL